MIRYVLVALGSAVGGVCRYGAAELIGARLAFPLPTLLVNVLGCLILSAVNEAALLAVGLPPPVRLLLTTGFCGGFTTYSTFNYEVATLGGRRGPLFSLLYFVCTVAGCLLAHVLGGALGRAFARR